MCCVLGDDTMIGGLDKKVSECIKYLEKFAKCYVL